MTSPVGSHSSVTFPSSLNVSSAPLEQQLDSPMEEQLNSDWLSQLAVGQILHVKAPLSNLCWLKRYWHVEIINYAWKKKRGIKNQNEWFVD